MSKNTPPSKPDKSSLSGDVPELTDAEFSKARPFSETFPKQHATWKRGRGRPKLDNPKKAVKVRLDADVLAWLKSDGKGYQTRLNTILRKAMKESHLHSD